MQKQSNCLKCDRFYAEFRPKYNRYQADIAPLLSQILTVFIPNLDRNLTACKTIYSLEDDK